MKPSHYEQHDLKCHLQYQNSRVSLDEVFSWGAPTLNSWIQFLNGMVSKEEPKWPLRLLFLSVCMREHFFSSLFEQNSFQFLRRKKPLNNFSSLSAFNEWMMVFQSVDKNEQKKFLIERIRAASRQT